MGARPGAQAATAGTTLSRVASADSRTTTRSDGNRRRLKPSDGVGVAALPLCALCAGRHDCSVLAVRFGSRRLTTRTTSLDGESELIAVRTLDLKLESTRLTITRGHRKREERVRVAAVMREKRREKSFPRLNNGVTVT